MKLTDFTLADISRLLGPSAVSGTPAPAQNGEAINGELNKNQLENADSPNKLNEALEEEAETETHRSTDWGSARGRKSPQKGSFIGRDDAIIIRPESKSVEGDLSETSNVPRQSSKMPDESDVPSTPMSRMETEEDPLTLVQTFLENLQRQIPAVLAVLQQLQTKDTGDHLRQYRNRFIDAQADEQRRYSTALRLSADLAQVSSLNTQLARDNEAVRQELAASQVHSRAYLEESTRLAEELTQLREESLQLRRGAGGNIGSFLQQTTAANTDLSVLAAAASTGFKATTPAAPAVGSLLSQFNNNVLAGVRTPVTSSDMHLLLPNSTAYLSGANSKTTLFSQAESGPPGGISRPDNETSAVDQKYIVTQPYKPTDYSTTDQFAQLTEGEVVTIVRDDPSGWWWVSNGTKAGEGWFPFSFLERATPQR